jgi:ribonuclease Z
VRPLFVPTLLHEPTGDPGLWVDVFDENRALLFDLGDVHPLPARKLIRVERVFVTHTHLDHFIGFDRFLRLLLPRERPCTVTGPPGFLERVAGKIAAYTWNLIRSYPVRITAEEIDGDVVRAVRYTGAGGMRPEPLPDRRIEGAFHAERLFTAHAALLDHGIPVLAYAVRETERLAVDPDRLARDGLRPGPWLGELKQAVRRCAPDDTPIRAAREDGAFRAATVGAMAAAYLRRAPGRRLAYVTDLRYTPEHVERVVELARGVDLLVCEATFLDADASIAADRGHLTARQCGEIARAAGAARLLPFHMSPRYKGRERELFEEAAAAFGGPISTSIEGGGAVAMERA